MTDSKIPRKRVPKAISHPIPVSTPNSTLDTKAETLYISKLNIATKEVITVTCACGTVTLAPGSTFFENNSLWIMGQRQKSAPIAEANALYWSEIFKEYVRNQSWVKLARKSPNKVKSLKPSKN